MRRREFIALLAGTAAAWPTAQAASAQQQAMPVIGWLSARSASQSLDTLAAFRRGLGEFGFVEGRNVLVEYRWAEGRNDRFPGLVDELIRQHVAAIVTSGSTPAALAAKTATRTIPIVFSTAADPVELGLVANLNQPGENLTGVTTLGAALGSKRVELLHELIPAATTIAVLLNPTNSRNSEIVMRDIQASASALGIQIHALQASTEAALDAAFAAVSEKRAGGLVIGADGYFTTRGEQLGALSLRYAVPAIYQYSEFTAAGGLMSYGGSFLDGIRLLGVYTGRILKGEKPGDLPVQQSTKAELIINMKTAKELGLTVPTALLVRADEVLE